MYVTLLHRRANLPKSNQIRLTTTSPVANITLKSINLTNHRPRDTIEPTKTSQTTGTSFERGSSVKVQVLREISPRRSFTVRIEVSRREVDRAGEISSPRPRASRTEPRIRVPGEFCNSGRTGKGAAQSKLTRASCLARQSRASAAGLGGAGGAGGGGGMGNINERTLEECWSTLQRVS